MQATIASRHTDVTCQMPSIWSDQPTILTQTCFPFGRGSPLFALFTQRNLIPNGVFLMLRMTLCLGNCVSAAYGEVCHTTDLVCAVIRVHAWLAQGSCSSVLFDNASFCWFSPRTPEVDQDRNPHFHLYATGISGYQLVLC